MNKMKSLILSCLSMMLCMTISAQTVSFVPNWEIGDTASFYYEYRFSTESGGATFNDTTSVVINLKVVSKDENGYTLNASFVNFNRSGERNDTLLKKYNITFDYKLDATGKLIGLADSTKVLADIKALHKEIAKDDSTFALVYEPMKEKLSDTYLSGLLKNVSYIHSLNGMTLKSNKTIETKGNKTFITDEFFVPATHKYTLESVKGNIVNVKCSSILNNEDIMPAYIEYGVQKLYSLFENSPEMIVMSIQELQDGFEKEYKKFFDLNITEIYHFSFDNSSKWLNSMSGTYTAKGKKYGNDVDNVTEITITKK